LIAEDSRRDIRLIKDAFSRRRLKHTLHFVDGGEQAAAYLLGVPPFDDRRTHPLPDLVMLDATLPIHTGFQILKWMKATAFLCQIPVCIMSSRATAGHQERATRLGATWFHLKRRDPAGWDRIVREICAKSSVGDGGTRK